MLDAASEVAGSVGDVAKDPESKATAKGQLALPVVWQWYTFSTPPFVL